MPGSPRKIRVLLVDDSAAARMVLRDMLESAPDMEVVGEACDGLEAVTLARALRPSLITMDVEMPGMDGLAAIEEIMASRAIPILVVSGTTGAHTSYEAISRGALEVIAKPDLDGADLFLERIRILSGVPVITHLRRRMAPGSASPAQHPLSQPPSSLPGRERAVPATAKPIAGETIFAIATSTGGPQALADLLPRLPADFGAPVLICQHIAEGFSAGMANWLNGLCRLTVTLAKADDPVRAGMIYIAPSERNLVVTPARTLRLPERGPEQVYRPSCDLMLTSVAEIYGASAVGLILTGMGRDGVEGIGRIRRAGGTTLAQDEATSLIYGMNGIAIERGLIDQVYPLGTIADRMIWLEKARRSQAASEQREGRP